MVAGRADAGVREQHGNVLTLIRIAIAVIAALVVVAALIAAPSIAANGLLQPQRRPMTVATPDACEAREFAGEGVTLRGWFCEARGKRRGTVIYLHGIADNRGSSVGTIQRYVPRGFDVIAYDGRRHGDSEGDVCTYGFLEKRDLRRVIAGLKAGPVVLIGTSLGAAVALQEAASDPQVASIVAAEVFSDLRTVATERAPRFLPPPTIRKAFHIAEQQGGFLVDAVSPMAAARTIRAPTLLIHGAEDHETSPAHSQRVYEALAGPRRLILVPGAGHNQSLNAPGIWVEIDNWVEESLEIVDRRLALLEATEGMEVPDLKNGATEKTKKTKKKTILYSSFSLWAPLLRF
jgi:pimeloyl-ACP methyl ester carboxylesterase